MDALYKEVKEGGQSHGLGKWQEEWVCAGGCGVGGAGFLYFCAAL